MFKVLAGVTVPETGLPVDAIEIVRALSKGCFWASVTKRVGFTFGEVVARVSTMESNAGGT